MVYAGLCRKLQYRAGHKPLQDQWVCQENGVIVAQFPLKRRTPKMDPDGAERDFEHT